MLEILQIVASPITIKNKKKVNENLHNSDPCAQERNANMHILKRNA